MSLINISSYELKKSKEEYLVPIVNNIHLHSVYNPIKEADALIEKHISTLENKNLILFLGLGLGYHINQAIKVLEKQHGDLYMIFVVEPNHVVIDDAKKHVLKNLDHVMIFSDEDPTRLYENREFVGLLSQSPGVITHPASFNLYQKYFKSFLGHRALQTMSDLVKTMHSSELKKYLEKFESNIDFNDLIKEKLYPSKKIKHRNDLLLMALHHMVQGKNKGTNGVVRK